MHLVICDTPILAPLSVAFHVAGETCRVAGAAQGVIAGSCFPTRLPYYVGDGWDEPSVKRMRLQMVPNLLSSEPPLPFRAPTAQLRRCA